MVEFDVVAAENGRLVLGHSHEQIEAGAPLLDEALEFVATVAPPEVGVDLDLKWYGFEEEIVRSLQRHGLLERALASSFFPESLRTLRRLEPALRTGISYPWDRHGLSEWRLLKPLVWTGAAALRWTLPHRIAAMAAAAEVTSAMLHYSVLSGTTVERCHALGLSVFVWTVDERGLLERVLATGVDGVISNDPRIFDGGEERHGERR